MFVKEESRPSTLLPNPFLSSTGSHSFVPTLRDFRSSRADAVKVGRRGGSEASSNASRPHLGGGEHDATLQCGSAGVECRGQDVFPPAASNRSACVPVRPLVRRSITISVKCSAM